MAFETLPVVHLERRRFPEYPGAEPERALTELARRFERVVIVDADGVRANDPDLEFIQTASKKRAIWMDAGSRFATDAMDLFIAGAERVTMRWNTLKSPRELEDAAHICQPGSLYVGLEYPRGAFLRHRKDKRTAAEVAALADALGIGIVLQTDHPDDAFFRTLPTAIERRYVQGATETQLEALEALAITGALISPAELPEDAE